MHQHPKQYLKDGLVVDNSWQLVAADVETLPSGDILVPVAYWQANQQHLADHSGNVGVLVDGHEEVEESPHQLQPIASCYRQLSHL